MKMKKEGKNEKLLIDLCECYISLSNDFSSECLSICVPCLLKVASNKERHEDIQEELEMALLALSNVRCCVVEQELYLGAIKEIIQYHQEHHNLTRLAYQSAWQFLINRLFKDKRLEDMIMNELHFGREASGELEELSKCVDWKREKAEEEEERGKERREELVIWRWLDAMYYFLYSCRLWNEELAGVIGSVVSVFQASRDNRKRISNQCIYLFKRAAENVIMKIDVLLNEGVVDLISEEMKQPSLKDGIMFESLQFLKNISRKLKEKEVDKPEEEKRKAIKRKIFEKMEEEGYEDCIESIRKIFDFLKEQFCDGLSLNIFDYFVNV
ncbi:uncharacterized protein MONOS_18603 [Monocercomonoides exilis]|uniref:uncharacterized protein n=1 Tax=Monocercomonoides exilis TaxID=2049356 RepID=UPI003559BE23|nr:hypothetical protein MONOS_18603 [Monocercomonoides exilis]